MSIATVVTHGFGNGTFNGTIPFVVTMGYDIGEIVITPGLSFAVFGGITQDGLGIVSSITEGGKGIRGIITDNGVSVIGLMDAAGVSGSGPIN